MKKAIVTTTWSSHHVIEDVPDEFSGYDLMDLPIDYLDVVTPVTADLVDWEIEWRDE